MLRRFAWVALCACSSKSAATPDAPSSPWLIGPTIVDRAGDARRLEPGVTALGTQLVVLGGFENSLDEGLTITAAVETLDTSVDPDQQAWASPWPDAPVQWTHIQLAAVGTSIYLLGGLAGAQYTAEGQAYRLDTLATPPLAWEPIASLPAGLERGSAAVIVAPPRIYLLGGAGTSDALATNLYYDVTMDAWCPGDACPTGPTLPDLPGPRSHPAGMHRADGTLILAGGLSTIDASEPDADVFWLPPEPATGAWTWQTKTPMPLAHGGAAYGVIGASLVLAGGEAFQSALHYAYSYDPDVDTLPTPPTVPPWTQLDDMPTERAGAQGAAIGQRLYVPGGAQQLVFQPKDTLFIYDASLAN